MYLLKITEDTQKNQTPSQHISGSNKDWREVQSNQTSTSYPFVMFLGSFQQSFSHSAHFLQCYHSAVSCSFVTLSCTSRILYIRVPCKQQLKQFYQYNAWLSSVTARILTRFCWVPQHLAKMSWLSSEVTAYVTSSSRQAQRARNLHVHAFYVMQYASDVYKTISYAKKNERLVLNLSYSLYMGTQLLIAIINVMHTIMELCMCINACAEHY